MLSKSLKGFTIVELIIVIGVLAVLAAITLAAINPAEQFAKSRDTKRRAAVEALSNAIQQYTAKQRGVLPEQITETETVISSSGVDLCDMLTPEYITSLPQDPQLNNGSRIFPSQCGEYDTGYTVQLIENDHFVVRAPFAETVETISQTR